MEKGREWQWMIHFPSLLDKPNRQILQWWKACVRKRQTHSSPSLPYLFLHDCYFAIWTLKKAFQLFCLLSNQPLVTFDLRIGFAPLWHHNIWDKLFIYKNTIAFGWKTDPHSHMDITARCELVSLARNISVPLLHANIISNSSHTSLMFFKCSFLSSLMLC